jgi:hypothetical protein
MAFLIGGHPRSGTTMLFRLCRDHPQIGITGEFKCFHGLDSEFADYYRAIETDWRHFSFYHRIGRRAPWYFKLGSGIFLAQYTARLRRSASGKVTLADVERALRAVLRRPVVGDKFPDYVFHLPDLAPRENLRRVIIYRDPRDVVSSFMKMLRTNWKGLPWAQQFKSAQDVARHWVRSVELMEQYRDRLLLLRYEDFVREPGPDIRRLAEYLGVDPAGFRAGSIHAGSIGKYARDLPRADVEAIRETTGPAMRRLGYR